MTELKENMEILKARPYLSKKEAILLTGLSMPTVDRMMKRGDWPYIKVGRAVRIKNIFN